MFEVLGLSPEETHLYTVLIQCPQATPSELAEYANSSLQKTSVDLDRLVRRGLANRVPGTQPRYIAIAPDVALTPLISKQEDLLRQARTESNELMEAFLEASRQTHPAELIEIITGADNIHSRTMQMQQAARSEVRGFDRPPYVVPAGSTTEEEVDRISDGIAYRVIYALDAVMIPGRLTGDIRETAELGEHARVRPHLPLKLVIYDDRRALIPIKTSRQGVDAAFIVHPCDLFDALTALFESEWERATPLRMLPSSEAPDTPEDHPDETSRVVLSCLAAGMTDENIARTMDCSLRTAQRHIQRLMQQLNASSRFQAGMAAHEHGWV